MKFGERVGKALVAMNWGPKEIESRSQGDVAMATISAIVTRQSDRTSFAEKIIACFPRDKISHDWLRSEKGEMLVTGEQPEPVKLEGKQDLSMALFNGFASLVRVLHRSGAMNAADLANDIGNTLDHRRTTGLETADQNQMLELLYRQVLQIEKHESDLAVLKADFEKKIQELRKPPDTDESL